MAEDKIKRRMQYPSQITEEAKQIEMQKIQLINHLQKEEIRKETRTAKGPFM